MPLSLPSLVVSSIDVPEVTTFKASFKYSYFSPDESTNDSGVSLVDILTGSNSFDSRMVELYAQSGKVPRFVDLEFAPVRLLETEASKDHGRNSVDRNAQSLRTLDLFALKNKILSEEQFSRSTFVGVGFQDTAIDGKLFLLVSESIARKVVDSNRNVNRQIDAQRRQILQRLNDGTSLQDAARFFASETPAIDVNFIMDSLSQIDSLNTQLIDDKGNRVMVNAEFDELKSLMFKAQLNGKVARQLVQSVIDDPNAQLNDEARDMADRIAEVQNRIRRSTDPYTVDDREYNLRLNDDLHIARIRALDGGDASSFKTTAAVVGYLIEKTMIDRNGVTRVLDDIIVTGPDATHVIDTRVTYGSRYVYGIRSIIAIEFPIFDSEAVSAFNAATILVKSRPVRTVVDCVESVPPPPPADLSVTWDTANGGPRIMWSFPVNPQRDIKRFQIYRRPSIDHPFELLKEYYFDDSFIKYENAEDVPDVLREYLDYPKTHYIDSGFDRRQSAIYAVVSIDAHGLSSGYSAQLEVRFDRLRNRINRRQVSRSNAPKQYPNFYLDEDVFPDVMKVSGFSRVKVFLDPEYLSLIDKGGADLKLLRMGAQDKYVLQFLNVDLQKSQLFNIILSDRRTR